LISLDFFFGVFFTLLGFAFLDFSISLAGRLPIMAGIVLLSKSTKATRADYFRAILLFLLLLGMTATLAAGGSVFLVRGILWILQ